MLRLSVAASESAFADWGNASKAGREDRIVRAIEGRIVIEYLVNLKVCW